MITQQNEQRQVSAIQTYETMSSDIIFMMANYRQMLIQYEKQVAELIKRNEHLQQLCDKNGLSSS